MYSWTTPVRYIKMIGPTRAKELVACGIETVGDLLEKQPLSYIFPGVTPIADAKEGMVVVKAKVVEIGRSWNTTIEAMIGDETGECKTIWYHSYAAQQLHHGMTATFYGKLKGGALQSPKWCTHDGGMESVYGGQYGVHHNTIRAALVEILPNTELPDMANGSNGNCNRVGCYWAYHFPNSKAVQQQALADLKADEALTLQLALQERRRGREGVTVEPMVYDRDRDQDILSYFPYKFTDDQETAIDDIVDTLVRATPMQRLIHGEVGSGKTAVAFYAAMLTALNSKRTLILCPTTILAQQHFDTLKGMGWDDVKLAHAGGSNETTDTHIIIGTHSILHADSLIASASLVIIDEFQKFGVEQKAKIQRHHPHLLLMSATPIPRSLAMTVFGDLDVSTIRELPVKRGTVITKWVLPKKREAMYSIIERELARGKQVYFIFPRIDGDEDTDNAVDGAASIRERFPLSIVSLLTGKNRSDMKAETLARFRSGKVDILVSTVLAEVGLDNSNATVMCIMDADRFGLSSLHQCRGRICRSVDTAYCFLVSDTANEKSIARLDVIEKCNCGFEIAEHDLRLRGAGEVFSTRQTGLPDLHWCSLVDDYDLMIEAKEIVASGSVGSGVREMIELRYGESLSLGGVR